MSQPKKRKGRNPAKPEPVDGILISYLENGTRVRVQPFGKTRFTELPTLLRQAAVTVERQMGIG